MAVILAVVVAAMILVEEVIPEEVPVIQVLPAETLEVVETGVVDVAAIRTQCTSSGE